MALLSVPRSLWDLYVEYLWNYQPHSWVASAASTFRVLAFVVILPFLLLTLLDVASYVIARTLGVVDDTKASTSSGEAAPTLSGDATPMIVVQGSGAAAGIPADSNTVPPLTYFHNPLEEHGNLQLSGVGTFSPAPSQPPSPTVARRELHQHEHNILRDTDEESTNDEEGGSGSGRPRQRGASPASSSGESFAILEHDAGADDTEVTMRRRARRNTEGVEAS